MLSVLGGISRARVPLRNMTNCVVFKTISANMCDKLSLYEEAVYALNGLQSNVATLQKSYAEKDANASKKLHEVEEHLETLGIRVSDLDSLNIIHVTGTKGKGSTCAFVESILRRHNFKTGFYSSPHLVSVTERIRINGTPIDKNLFVKYFWEVYNPLQQNLTNGKTMPPYFMFLTVMAFYIFIKEQVEAAVIEVGIGGLYDCTNIIKKPMVVGISSLGIDHVKLLGNTLPLIAEQKAGIFKSGVPAFTVPQHESAMKVLYEKAKEINCPLKIAPPLEIYDHNLKLGIPGDVQSINASLAIQLVSTWLRIHSSKDIVDLKSITEEYEKNEGIFVPMAPSFPLALKFKEGLESCVWPGRCQILEKNGVTLYLDGAHTNQSLKHCAKWFEEASEKERNKLKIPALRVLLFNCTGMRNVERLLDPLSDLDFDLVLFSPNRKTVMKDSSADQSNFRINPEEEIHQCIINKEVWGHMINSINENALNKVSQASPNVVQQDVATSLLKEDNSVVFCCLSTAVDFLVYKKHIKHCVRCDKSESFLNLLNSTCHIQALVTGSLHLVGGVMSLTDS